MTDEPSPPTDEPAEDETPNDPNDEGNDVAGGQDAQVSADLVDDLTEEEADSLLLGQTYRMVADRIRGGAMVFKAPDVEGGTGSPGAVRDFALAVAKLVEATKELLRIKRVDFARSATFYLVPETQDLPDAESLKRALEASAPKLRETPPTVPQLSGDERDPPAAADDEKGLDPLDAPVPEVLLGRLEALERISSIITLPPEEAYAAANEYRAELGGAYTDLSKVLVRRKAKVQVEVNDEVAGEITQADAHEALRLVEEPSEAPPQRVTTRGFLRAADASHKTFRLLLDDDARPEGLHPNTKYIEGKYSGRAERQVLDQGLWNKRVVVELVKHMEQRVDRRAPTLTEWVFEEVRPFGAD